MNRNVGVDAAPLKGIVLESDFDRVFTAIRDAVHRSVLDDQRAHPLSPIAWRGATQRDIKQRASICIEWIRDACAGSHFSLTKALDLMPHALRQRLDGNVDFSPAHVPGMWRPT